MPKFDGNLICEVNPVSIFATVRELSFAAQVSRIGQSGLISLSTATSSISELELTINDFSYLPVIIFISFSDPSLAAQKMSSGLSKDGCNWQINSEAWINLSNPICYTFYIHQ